MKNVPKNLRFEVSPEEFRTHLKRVERIEKELIRAGYLYDCVVDGKPLTDGEIALIKALRKVKIKRVNCDEPTKWTYLLTNESVFSADIVVRVESEGDEECSAIGDAIFMIKTERTK